ncbi:MAG TPA: GNAT family protein [Pseudonocardiaceae bacterium]|nr:GNAT family protein [Pseudonocardiaceae bacterium]
MFTPAFPILTDRLSLRRFTMDDLEPLHAMLSREDVSRFLLWGPRDLAQVKETLTQRVNQYRFDELNDVISIAAARRDTDQFIGSAKFSLASREHRTGELGYVLHPDHYGQGYATEIAIALLRLGFEDAGLHRMYGACDGRNVASARVMAKAGMRQEAHLVENEFIKGEWTDELIYGLLAKEWHAR